MRKYLGFILVICLCVSCIFVEPEKKVIKEKITKESVIDTQVMGVDTMLSSPLDSNYSTPKL